MNNIDTTSSSIACCESEKKMLSNHLQKVTCEMNVDQMVVLRERIFTNKKLVGLMFYLINERDVTIDKYLSKFKTKSDSNVYDANDVKNSYYYVWVKLMGQLRVLEKDFKYLMLISKYLEAIGKFTLPDNVKTKTSSCNEGNEGKTLLLSNRWDLEN